LSLRHAVQALLDEAEGSAGGPVNKKKEDSFRPREIDRIARPEKVADIPDRRYFEEQRCNERQVCAH
jgi:hypothetical protein